MNGAKELPIVTNPRTTHDCCNGCCVTDQSALCAKFWHLHASVNSLNVGNGPKTSTTDCACGQPAPVFISVFVHIGQKSFDSADHVGSVVDRHVVNIVGVTLDGFVSSSEPQQIDTSVGFHEELQKHPKTN